MNGNDLGLEVYALNKSNTWISITINHVEKVYTDLDILDKMEELWKKI